MTGEVTLRGRVLPIGGLKEKIHGAKRAGIRHILYPGKNLPDMKDIPNHLKKSLHLHNVDHLDEVLDYALVGGLKALEKNAKTKNKISRKKPEKPQAPAQA